MTTLKFNEIPVMNQSRRRRRSTAVSKAHDAMFAMAERGIAHLASRRAFRLPAALTVLMSQLMPMQISGPWTAGFPWDQFYDCGGYQYTGDCGRPCFGFEPHHMDPFYCATCDEAATVPNNYHAWHYIGSRGSIQYMDSGSDPCRPGGQPGRDAWKWTINGACGNCNDSSTYRCHDGYKKYPASASWDPTICEGLVICDGELIECP